MGLCILLKGPTGEPLTVCCETGGTYRVVWPQSLGGGAPVLRVQHVEETHLVGMLLALGRGRGEKEEV